MASQACKLVSQIQDFKHSFGDCLKAFSLPFRVKNCVFGEISCRNPESERLIQTLCDCAFEMNSIFTIF